FADFTRRRLDRHFGYIDYRTANIRYYFIEIIEFLLNPPVIGIAGCIFQPELGETLFPDLVQSLRVDLKPHTFLRVDTIQFFGRYNFRHERRSEEHTSELQSRFDL